MSMWKRVFGFAAALAGLTSPVPAQPAHVTADAAPAAWVRYAGLMEQQFTAKLGGDSDPAKRLRAYLAQSSNAAGAIPVEVWVGNTGMVSRVTFNPFLDGQANADLASLLQGVTLPEAPPSGILLPVRLNLHVNVKPADTAGDSKAP